ncbi:ABC-F family ATP-binding cassette domain-containing protein [Prosthecochloris vibrioformis]|uniref:Probable ATP-binding protein YbiT n=1 Tax=Prosthecochloris vibrioformis TaxID=1098 RepID=A0A5C4S3Q3_PROVB|nr:ABC-F family ATP-binding cassette domain-containing protein [Prosthecochloris vibrioformis]TNJ38123.1 ABC-F family ATP-binding cassette domain-containing protein [Prosthecochloris vibrioformis]
MFDARNISLSAGTKELLNNASFRIGDKDRVGLVGLNGTGKSTLLRFITATGSGTEVISSGEITKSASTTIGYLPQEISFEDDLETTALHYALQANKKLNAISERIERLQQELEAPGQDHESDAYHKLIEKFTEASHEFERLGGYTMEGEAEKILTGLGFSRESFHKKVREFSGGWQMRLLIAKLLLQNPTLLLLDEPTNHLDIDSLRWLENYLLNYDHSCVIVSHDRFFLDKITTKTLEINFRTITEYKGNYSYYEKEKAERFELMMARYENDKKKIAHLQSFVDRFRYKATKARQAQSRLRQMQRLEEELVAPEEDNSKISFSFPKANPSGRVVLRFSEIGKSYPTPDGSMKQILRNIDLEVLRGDRIAVVGSNGAGKTTFCRIVAGNLEHEGTRTLGHNVSMSYFGQHQTEELETSNTILEEMLQAAPDAASQRRIRDILGCFLFSGDSVEKKIGVLSGGEKSRVALAKILLQASNLLIMDEPTNHLDMRSKEMLIDALENYDGTMLLVSHDRYFLDSLVNKVVEIRNGSLQLYLGSYGEYLQKSEKNRKAEEEVQATAPSVTTQKKAGKQTPAQPKANSNGRKAESIEKKIAELELRKEKLELVMGKNDFYQKPAEETETILREYGKVEQELERQYELWEQALA